MIFVGHAELSIDSKQRISMPAKFKNRHSVERDGAAWYCVPYGRDRLVLYTEKRFEALAEARDSTLTPNRTQSRFDSAYFGLAERIEPDSAGRVMISKLHKQLAGLGDEVVMLGNGKGLEIWDKAKFEQQLTTMHEYLDNMMDELDTPKQNPGKPTPPSTT